MDSATRKQIAAENRREAKAAKDSLSWPVILSAGALLIALGAFIYFSDPTNLDPGATTGVEPAAGPAPSYDLGDSKQPATAPTSPSPE